jgi:hypothetical protein
MYGRSSSNPGGWYCAAVRINTLTPLEAPGDRSGPPPRRLLAASLRSDGRRGRRAQEEIGADTPIVGRIFTLEVA